MIWHILYALVIKQVRAVPFKIVGGGGGGGGGGEERKVF